MKDFIQAFISGALIMIMLVVNAPDRPRHVVTPGTEEPNYICPVDGHIYWDNETPCYFCGGPLSRMQQ